MSDVGDIEVITKFLKISEDIVEFTKKHIERDETIRDMLTEYKNSLENLMSKILINKEEVVQNKSDIEIINQKMNTMDEEHDEFKTVLSDLEFRLRKIDFEKIRSVWTRFKSTLEPSRDDIKLIDDMLSTYVDDPYLLGIKSVFLFNLGEEAEALKLIDDSLDKKPTSPWLWYQKGVLYPPSEFDAKMEAFEKALNLTTVDSNKHHIYYSKTVYLCTQSKFEEAIEAADESIKYSPKCPEILNKKADILLILDRIPEALGIIERALELDDKNLSSNFVKAKILTVLGEEHYEEAIVYYDKVLNIDPTSTIAYFNKGSILWSQKKLELALENIDEGLKLSQEYVCPFCQRAAILCNLGRPKEAYQAIEIALSMDLSEIDNYLLDVGKDCTMIIAYKGIILAKLERNEEAKKVFEELVRIDPKNEFYKSLFTEIEEEIEEAKEE